MKKNKIKLSLVATLAITGFSTSAVAGIVTAPNVDKIEISGDAELKFIKAKTDSVTGSQTNNHRTAEVNLNFDASFENGLKVFTTFTAFDDTQASATQNTDVRTKVAYAEIPILEKGKILAGLVPNFQYGTEAFDIGGEAWKVAVFVPVAKGVQIGLVSKIENEEESNDDKGDSGATELRIDAKISNLNLGAKYVSAYANKDDGVLGADATPSTGDEEVEKEIMTAYITGAVAEFNIGAEYFTADVKKVGAATQPKDMKGYFLSISKEFGAFNAGLSYINLSNGMNGGSDYAPGLITDDYLSASTTKDTSAYILPVSYAINDTLSLNATYIDIDNKGVDENEFDLGLEYAMMDGVTIGAMYGKLSSDTPNADQTNIEVAIAIEF